MKPIEINPYAVLGISQDADNEKILYAYKTKKEQDPNNSEIDKAYSLIKTEGLKKRTQFLSPAPLNDISQLPDLVPTKPKYVGPGAWLKVIRKNLPEK